MSINSIGNRIKALRKSKKLTLKDLSEKANISVSFLSDIENSRSKPSLERLNDIAIALGTTTSYLMGEDKNFENIHLNKKDEKDIVKVLEETKQKLENTEGLMFDGEPASPEAIQSILQAMEMGMALAKQKNKEKYTPKKYKKK